MGSNVAEPLRPRTLPSTPAPKTAEPREGGLANVDVQTRPITPLCHRSYFLLQLQSSARSSVTAMSLDPGKGSAPASQAWVQRHPRRQMHLRRAGQLVGAQVGLSVLTSGLTAAQADEIFQLSRDIQTLRGKLALDFIKMSYTEANFRMEPRQPATRPRFRSIAQVRPGCTSILHSSFTLSIINSSW